MDTQPTLRELADRRNILVGAAVIPSLLDEEPVYAETLAREFNCLVAENCMKFSYLQPEQGRFDFTEADRLVEFAQTHDMAVRGHTLVWHNQLPDWLKTGAFTRLQAMEILQTHIETVVEHFKGKVFCWDVVNEALDDTYHDYRIKSDWYRLIGPDYIELAFRWAHDVDPDLELIYNDYDLESIDGKFDKTLTMLRRLLDRNIPIHGVGFQYHHRSVDIPTFHDLVARFERVERELGLPCHITELDLSIEPEITDEQLALQAEAYRSTMDAVVASKDCNTFVMWGVTDKYSWVPGFTKGQYDHALLFDRDYQPKPAYTALHEALA